MNGNIQVTPKTIPFVPLKCIVVYTTMANGEKEARRDGGDLLVVNANLWSRVVGRA